MREPVDRNDRIRVMVVVPGHRAVLRIDQPSGLDLVQLHAQGLERAQEALLDHGQAAADIERVDERGDRRDEAERGVDRIVDGSPW